MKASQYILFSFFGFIILATFVLYIDSVEVVNDNRSELIEHQTKFPPKQLESFLAIVAEPHSRIQIIQDSNNSLSIDFIKKNTSSKFPDYKIINDTLFISKSDALVQTIIRCRSLHSIIGQNKSIISLNNFNTDSLSIYLNESRLEGTLNDQSIKTLKISVRNQSQFSLNLDRSKIEYAALKGDNTRLDLFGNSYFHILDIELKNSSVLSLSGKREKLTIDSDTSSRYNIRDQQ